MCSKGCKSSKLMDIAIPSLLAVWTISLMPSPMAISGPVALGWYAHSNDKPNSVIFYGLVLVAGFALMPRAL